MQGERYITQRRCVGCERDRRKIERQIDPHKFRRRVRRATYRQLGLDPDLCMRTLDAHNGRCDCCKTTDPKGGRRGRDHRGWNIDHCHRTMRIRGVLCSNCNRGIGMLGDTLEGVKMAYEYLCRVEAE